VTDASKLEAVYAEHGPRLWRALVAYSTDPEIASDAVAEAFAQALAGGDRVRSPASWIWRAAFKIAAGELQLRGRSLPPADEPQ
jgi:DNA-directed RNA polymerase specialized sigma24 family protein